MAACNNESRPLHGNATQIFEQIYRARDGPLAGYAQIRDRIVHDDDYTTASFMVLDEVLEARHLKHLAKSDPQWEPFFGRARERIHSGSSKAEAARKVRCLGLLVSFWSREVVEHYDWCHKGVRFIRTLAACVKLYPNFRQDFVPVANYVMFARHTFVLDPTKASQKTARTRSIDDASPLVKKDLEILATLSEEAMPIYHMQGCKSSTPCLIDIGTWMREDGSAHLNGSALYELWTPKQFSKYLLGLDRYGMLVPKAFGAQSPPSNPLATPTSINEINRVTHPHKGRRLSWRSSEECSRSHASSCAASPASYASQIETSQGIRPIEAESRRSLVAHETYTSSPSTIPGCAAESVRQALRSQLTSGSDNEPCHSEASFALGRGNGRNGTSAALRSHDHENGGNESDSFHNDHPRVIGAEADEGEEHEQSTGHGRAAPPDDIVQPKKSLAPQAREQNLPRGPSAAAPRHLDLRSPKPVDPRTVEEVLYAKYYGMIHSYKARLRTEASTRFATDTCKARAAWLTPSTCWARVFASGAETGTAVSEKDAEVLYLSSDQFQQKVNNGSIFNKPVVLRTSYADHNCHSVAAFLRQLEDSYGDATIDSQNVHNPQPRSVRVSQFVELVRSRSTDMTSDNALNFRCITKAHAPLFTYSERFRLLETLVARTYKHPGKQITDTSHRQETGAAYWRDVASCLSFNIFGLAGAFSGAHVDSLAGTWVRNLDGIKLWMIIPVGTLDTQDWCDFQKQGSHWLPVDKQRLILLEKGDTIFMPPGKLVVHAVHTPDTSLMEGGMIWDERDILSILHNIRWIWEHQKITNEPVALELPSIIEKLRRLVESDPDRYFEGGRLDAFNLEMNGLRRLSCRCLTSCRMTTCDCIQQARRCTPWCRSHRRLVDDMRACMQDPDAVPACELSPLGATELDNGTVKRSHRHSQSDESEYRPSRSRRRR